MCFSGDMGFRRLQVSIKGMHPRPKRPFDGFPSIFCDNALIILKFGSLLDVGAPKEKRVLREYLRVHLPFTGFRGS